MRRFVRIGFSLGLALVFLCIMLNTIPNAYAEPANTYLYSINQASDSISVINPITNQKITDISTDHTPVSLCINPAGTYLYITYNELPYVDVFSTIDYSHITRFTFTGSTVYLVKMAISDDGRYLYLSVGNLYRVYKIDVTNGNVVATSGLIYNPAGIIYYNGFVYVLNSLDGQLVKLNSDTLNVVQTIGTFRNVEMNQSESIAIDTYNGYFIVGNINATATVIDSDSGTIIGMLNLGRNDHTKGVYIGVNSSGYSYIANPNSGNVTIFEDITLTLKLNITGFNNPYSVVANQYNTTIYVASRNDNRIYVLNNIINLGYIEVGNSPTVLTISTQSTPYQHLIKFVAESTFGIFKYADVTVTVYDQNNNIIYSQNTDDNGAVSFYLNPTTNYRLWFYSVDDNINVNKTFTPYDDTYYVEVKGLFPDFNPFSWWQGIVSGWTGAGSGSVDKDISTYYTVNTTSNPRLITIVYTDTTASTTSINFTLMRYWQNNNTYTVYNTTLISGSGIGSQQMPISVPVGLADGQAWRITVTSVSLAYGTVTRNDDYRFPGVAYPIPGLPVDWYPYIAFGLVFIVGIMFTYVSTGIGLLVMAALSLIMVGLGWVPFSESYVLLMQVLAVFGVGQIFKMRKQREGI